MIEVTCLNMPSIWLSLQPSDIFEIYPKEQVRIEIEFFVGLIFNFKYLTTSNKFLIANTDFESSNRKCWAYFVPSRLDLEKYIVDSSRPSRFPTLLNSLKIISNFFWNKLLNDKSIDTEF
ncbi:hypothetical protein BpHYR1_049923 [Brachionus plicatilis]|uniref:Uncharacterized protein n=1 Tax=Brachionus plicatilis TaxID=10195 RepID=A0A3M7S685_BRAPC|nr:hypothetical protein BpHYR1_049923 [Brachionus plicatilis]